MRTVAVIAGGISSEHEVSRWSGARVLAGLDRRRYRPIEVTIDRDGTWTVDGVRRGGPLEGAQALLDRGCDVCFLALHGPFGEDGTIQGFLETVGLPYTGSAVGPSALAADKVRAKRLVQGAGVSVAPDVVLPPATLEDAEALGWPLFVKDPFGGSTLEVRRACDRASLEAAVAELSVRCDRLLVEAAVAGRELTVAILDDAAGVPRALPVTEVRAPDDFFDFESKYTAGIAEEIVPAPLAPDVARLVQEAALRAHTVLGLRGLSRVDFMLDARGTPVFLEANSIPGLTPNSILPKAAAAAGIDFAALLSGLVEGALALGGGRHDPAARREPDETATPRAATGVREGVPADGALRPPARLS